ncbi:hypothetical protein GPEL0_01f1056 [Geoanaerobacter pelophilus]|uniref:Small CPxCG-related zinc finger protein n=1 Tax=Geoanaerobacter pelophilus TaxID=60036 RepID=A0ABQ0MFQ5_9BACT|nr:hypothetical protein [Geoanaerobacter pelophilus]GAW65935.1 hypothetical protein GPEL0_01f1056 [Geoanaerobacter pelophilus]
MPNTTADPCTDCPKNLENRPEAEELAAEGLVTYDIAQRELCTGCAVMTTTR